MSGKHTYFLRPLNLEQKCDAKCVHMYETANGYVARIGTSDLEILLINKTQASVPSYR
jgi:hypothetical protein